MRLNLLYMALLLNALTVGVQADAWQTNGWDTANPQMKQTQIFGNHTQVPVDHNFTFDMPAKLTVFCETITVKGETIYRIREIASGSGKPVTFPESCAPCGYTAVTLTISFRQNDPVNLQRCGRNFYDTSGYASPTALPEVVQFIRF